MGAPAGAGPEQSILHTRGRLLQDHLSPLSPGPPILQCPSEGPERSSWVKICVDIQSDGDLLMTSSALYTAAHHKIPLLIVMHNNQSFYNSEEHNIQIAKFRKRPVTLAGIGTQVNNPPVNFKMLAQGFGMYGNGPIIKPDDLRPALKKALAVVKEKKQPALVDVISASR